LTLSLIAGHSFPCLAFCMKNLSSPRLGLVSSLKIYNMLLQFQLAMGVVLLRTLVSLMVHFVKIFAFIVLDFQDPHSIAVLLQNDLVVVDLTSQG